MAQLGTVASLVKPIAPLTPGPIRVRARYGDRRSSARQTSCDKSMLACRSLWGFWSFPGLEITQVAWDWMHAVDLGVALQILGNTFAELLKSGLSIAHLMGMIKAAASALKVLPPIHTLNPTQVQQKLCKAPVLKVKAAEAKHLIPITNYILQNFVERDSEHNKLRAHCVAQLAKCYAIIDEWTIDAVSSPLLGCAGRRFFMLYNTLSQRALARDARGIHWGIFPKFHGFIHLCEGGCNRRATWNYCEESAIGMCATLAERCHPLRIAVRIIEKYRLMHLGR